MTEPADSTESPMSIVEQNPSRFNSHRPTAEMHQIVISNRQDVLPLDERLLCAVVRDTLNQEHIAQSEISLAIVDNPAIRELNRNYLRHDYDTDVLSFRLDESPLVSVAGNSIGSPDRERQRERTVDGEIVASAEMAVNRATEFGWHPHDELLLYLVHGILHLTGYDDRTEEDKSLMRSRERTVLQRWIRWPVGDGPDHAKPKSDLDPPHTGGPIC